MKLNQLTISNFKGIRDLTINFDGRDASIHADNTYLLDIALKALSGEGPDADQLAVLIDAARRAA